MKVRQVFFDQSGKLRVGIVASVVAVVLIGVIACVSVGVIMWRVGQARVASVPSGVARAAAPRVASVSTKKAVTFDNVEVTCSTSGDHERVVIDATLTNRTDYDINMSDLSRLSHGRNHTPFKFDANGIENSSLGAGSTVSCQFSADVSFDDRELFKLAGAGDGDADLSNVISAVKTAWSDDMNEYDRKAKEAAEKAKREEESKKAEEAKRAQEAVKAEEARKAEEAKRAEEERARQQAAQQSNQRSQAVTSNNSNSSSSGGVRVASEADIASWASRIDAYLAGHTLAGYGEVFARKAYEYGIDPRVSPAISIIESGGGDVCFKPHNAWGWGQVSWPNWEAAIEGHISGLAQSYGPDFGIDQCNMYSGGNGAFYWSYLEPQLAAI